MFCYLSLCWFSINFCSTFKEKSEISLHISSYDECPIQTWTAFQHYPIKLPLSIPKRLRLFNWSTTVVAGEWSRVGCYCYRYCVRAWYEGNKPISHHLSCIFKYIYFTCIINIFLIIFYLYFELFFFNIKHIGFAWSEMISNKIISIIFLSFQSFFFILNTSHYKNCYSKYLN